MHEYPLTQQIIRIAEKCANEHAAKRVDKISLIVGDYSGVVAECISLYFDIISKDTLCEHAILDIERVKPLLRCKKCDSLFERQPFTFACTNADCDGEGEPTEIGREFYVKSIEAGY